MLVGFGFGEMLSLLMAWSNFDFEVGEPLEGQGLDKSLKTQNEKLR